MKAGDIVLTPDGKAKIKFVEDYPRIKKKRIAVELEDKNRYSFSPVCYWIDEVKTL